MPKHTVRLYCHAAHERQAPPLGDVTASVELRFVGIAGRLPMEPDGRLWLACPSKHCRAWNAFDVEGDDRSVGGGLETA